MGVPCEGPTACYHEDMGTKNVTHWEFSIAEIGETSLTTILLPAAEHDNQAEARYYVEYTLLADDQTIAESRGVCLVPA